MYHPRLPSWFHIHLSTKRIFIYPFISWNFEMFLKKKKKIETLKQSSRLVFFIINEQIRENIEKCIAW